MTILGLIVLVAVIGLLTWALTTLVPMDPKFKQIIYVIAIVGTVLYVLSAIGVLGHIPNPRLGG